MPLDYALLVRAAGDPTPLVGNGKLYAKGPDGNVQAFYEDDAGNVYQLTPAAAPTPYPYPTAEVPDPAPVPNTGFIYAKDVAGVTQLFYIDSAGNVYQLTPVAAPTPNYQFIFDAGAVPSGNLYNDMSTLLAAANALDGVKLIFLLSDTPTLNAGTFNFADCHIEAPYAFNTIEFSGTATVTAMPLKLTNVFFRYIPSDPNHVLCEPGNIAPNLDLILDGFSALVCTNPPIGDAGRMFQFQGTNRVYVRHQSFVNGPNNPVDAPAFNMFGVDVGFGGTVKFVLASSAGIIGGDANQLLGGNNVNYEITGKGSFLDLSGFTNGQRVVYLRGSDDKADGDELTTTIDIGANQVDYLSRPMVFSRFTRWNVTAACSIDGFVSNIPGYDIRTSNRAPHMRWHFNVGAFNLTIVQSGASAAAADNQVITNTGANLVVAPNERFWLWWDTGTQKWRAGKS